MPHGGSVGRARTTYAYEGIQWYIEELLVTVTFSLIFQHFAQSRYGRLTPLAKTLQEDPSCQLCTILQNYVLLSEIASIESNLKESDLPLLSTLRQVIMLKTIDI